MQVENDIIAKLENLDFSYPMPMGGFEGFRLLLKKSFARHRDTDKRISVLKNISFEIKRGERVGLVGRNGAGKSTMLKLLGGRLRPDSGTCYTSAPPFLLSADSVKFNSFLSFKRNIEEQLGTKGFTREEIERKTEAIREFVSLGVYFEEPMSKLSLGMQARSQFALGLELVKGGVVMVDEVLTAGDLYWQRACARFAKESLERHNSGMIVVSHSLEQVRSLCDRCLWIENGEIVKDGDVSEVVREYEAFLEHVSWRGDLDEKGDTVTDQATKGLRRTLKRGDNEVECICFPGSREFEFTSFSVNGVFSNRIVLSAINSVSVTFICVKNFSGQVRVAVNFMTEEGKRIALLENDEFTASTKVDQSLTVNFHLEDGISFRGEKLWMSLSLFQIESVTSTADEMSTRIDTVTRASQIELENEECFSLLRADFVELS